MFSKYIYILYGKYLTVNFTKSLQMSKILFYVNLKSNF